LVTPAEERLAAVIERRVSTARPSRDDLLASYRLPRPHGPKLRPIDNPERGFGRLGWFRRMAAMELEVIATSRKAAVDPAWTR
jgi:hypothetical protein